MDINTLKNLLKNHDWTWYRSDDYSKWLNGFQSEQAITDAMHHLGNTDDIKKLYYDAMPEALRSLIAEENAIHGESV